MNYETNSGIQTEIFNVTKNSFLKLALEIARFQYQKNAVYKAYCNQIKKKPSIENSITDLAFLPISFFKTHTVKSYIEKESITFFSSGTTAATLSKHYVKDAELYEKSFLHSFQLFYGHLQQYTFLFLLPSYLEKEGSSLIYMAQKLIELSANADSGFFLQAQGKLIEILQKREAAGKKTILMGVTYALLDFAEQTPFPLNHTIIMETGGMKGRRAEITRAELHNKLKIAFGVPAIHSEYGMTELLSQAYAYSNGIYRCPPWMRLLVRTHDDPFDIKTSGTGIICIIDLANLHSCSFIETGDIGKIYADGSFEILGRMDNSDVRGCSLLTIDIGV